MTPRPKSTTRPASTTTKTLAPSLRAVRTPAPAAPRATPSRAQATAAKAVEPSRVLDLTLLLESEPIQPTVPRKSQPNALASEQTTPQVAPVVQEKNGVPSATAESTPAVAPVARPRAIKRRSPADLAGQYAREDKAAKRAPVALPMEATKTILRGKAAREAKEQRRQAMAVSDTVLQRLRNTAAPSSLVVTLTDAPDDIPVKKGRGYEVECGKCGTSRKFSTPATLCARCGAILVKA